MFVERGGPEDFRVDYLESYSASQMGPEDPHHVDVVGGTFVLTDGQLEACKRNAREAADDARNPAAAASVYHARFSLLKSDIIGLDPPGSNEFIPAA
jgi:hypothetical protein